MLQKSSRGVQWQCFYKMPGICYKKHSKGTMFLQDAGDLLGTVLLPRCHSINAKG